MKKQNGLIILPLCILMFMFLVLGSLLLLLVGCSDFQYDTDRDRVITSPDKSYSLLLRYDYVSRPSIFKDGELIYEYKGSGFMESVGFNIKWVSDDEILLYLESPKKEKYKNEQFYINVKND